jgi:glycosyltransferase involved in cell wall biosynthesis
MIKILFITTSNIATNPRLLKEVQLAYSNHFDITIIQFKYGGWSAQINKDLKNNFENVCFIEISATRTPLMPWLISSIYSLFLQRLPLSFLSSKTIAYRLNKRAYLIDQHLKNIKSSFDWVIAHNLGAFYPALRFAKRNNAKLGLDIEDYHSGESLNKKQNQLIKAHLESILHKSDYCSFASPLIREEILNETVKKPKKSLLILNGFNKSEFLLEENSSSKLKLVWYSQNIDFMRGLESIIPIVNNFCYDVELTLIGNLNKDFARHFDLENSKNIKVLKPLIQQILHSHLSSYDVGLALEVGKDRNNEIALSNKLISYVQSGLFVLAFDTPAQRKFIIENKIEAFIIANNEELIRKKILKLISMKRRNKLNKIYQFQIGKQFDWLKISDELLQTWRC